MKPVKFFCIFLLLMGNGTALAGEAVSDINGKMDLSYGGMESDRGTNVSGSISLPLSEEIGLQVDGLYTGVSSRDFYGAGAQLFWRDPQQGLLGISCAGIYEEDMYSLQGGLAGEYYLDLFTISLKGGIAKIKYDNGSVPFIETNETKPYGGGTLGFYPIDDLLFLASYTYAFDNGLFQGRIEYQTPVSGFSVFADIARGEHDYDHNLFGIRYYFGKQKSLKQRHREDDPPNIVNSVLCNIGTYGAEYNEQARKYVERLIALYGDLIIIDPGEPYGIILRPGTYVSGQYGVVNDSVTALRTVPYGFMDSMTTLNGMSSLRIIPNDPYGSTGYSCSAGSQFLSATPIRLDDSNFP